MPTTTPPQGIITCLFTDIEGYTHVSTRLRQADYVRWVERHRERLRTLFAEYKGNEVDTQGDAFFATFQYSRDALACANAIQHSLRDEPISEADKDDATVLHTIRVRIGIYRARREVFLRGAANYIDSEINLASRIIKGGVGGQILVSDLARQEAGGADDYQWETWKSRRLKDFDAPEDVHELLWDGKGRGEPGTRWLPDWYRGERNAYIPRVDKEKEILEYFAKKPSNGNPVRMVTLKGFGGMGKTRLGLTCALQCAGMFGGKVYFVRLEDREKSPEAVAEAIGTALGLEGEQRLPKNLIPILRDTNALLMLDNYESVHCPNVQKFLRDLLHHTSHLRLLVTGRESVKIANLEQPVDIEGLTEPEARQLFIARAQLVQPNWQPTTPQEESALSDILRLTERIPLALELVAAGMGDDAYGSVELVARTLESTSLPALPEGYISDASERHESLTRCLDWSYNLLDADAQDGFTRLGLFADTFTPDTVEKACGVTNGGKLLTRLAQASLVKRVEPRAELRYTFLRPARAYAHDKLNTRSDADVLRHAHITYYQAVADENGGADGRNINDASKRRIMNAEWRNIVGAVEASERLHEWHVVQELAANMGDFLHLRGLWSELVQMGLRAQNAARAANNPQNEAGALNNLGVVYRNLGRWDESITCLEQGLVIERKIGTRRRQGVLLNNLGVTYRSMRRWNEAISCYEQSLEISREYNDRRLEGQTLTNLGVTYCCINRDDEAINYFEHDLAICREINDRIGEGQVLINIGNLHTRQEHWEAANTCYEQSFAIFQAADTRISEGETLWCMALLRYKQGDISGALEVGQQALNVLEPTQSKLTEIVRKLVQDLKAAANREK